MKYEDIDTAADSPFEIVLSNQDAVSRDFYLIIWGQMAEATSLLKRGESLALDLLIDYDLWSFLSDSGRYYTECCVEHFCITGMLPLTCTRSSVNASLVLMRS